MNSNTRIIFRGSFGDAADFQKNHHLRALVSADLDGKISEGHGVKACPTILFPSRSGASAIVGNGAGISAAELRAARDLLKAGA